VSEIRAGDGEVLAQLHLPESVAGTLDEFVLHPSLIDAAFQALFGLVAGNPRKNGQQSTNQITFLPFAVDRIDVVDKCEIEMFAWIRPEQRNGSSGADAGKVDIDLCDNRGRIRVRLRGLLARPMGGAGLTGDEGFRSRATAWFKGLIAASLGRPSREIDENRPLESYGLNSILVVELTKAIRAHGFAVDTTLFFEVRTARAIAGYFIENQADKLINKLCLKDEPGDRRGVDGNGPREKSASRHEPAGNAQFGIATQPVPRLASGRPVQTREIAIIGLAGRYPNSRDISEFWRNLREGINCISEIPPDRWDWRNYFDQVGRVH
jgi:aryl carrier-like protein